MILSMGLALIAPAAGQEREYPWKGGKSFEIYHVGGVDSVFLPGGSISLDVEGRALATHVSPEPENGFHVQAYIDHEDLSRSLAGGNGEWDDGLRGWRVELKAPTELRDHYRLRVSLYCGYDESACAETYGRAAQTSKTFYFDVR